MSAPLDLIRDMTDSPAPDRLVIANISRRRFLQEISAVGGFALAVGFPATTRAADPPK